MVATGSRVLRAASRRRTLVVALAAIYGALPQLAMANPGGAVVVHGQATLQTEGNKLTVTNTPGAIIHWQQFSIGAGQTTFFQQQNAASTVLNRVQTQNPALKSQIDGTLGSNGRVFLINPNGIVFGAGSRIDTQGFVASTLSLRDEDFKAGKFKFTRDGVAGDIQVQGRISSGNGDVYLIAPNVGVDGNAVISSQGGNVVLAAGEMVEITGRNLDDITFEVQSPGNQVVNLGRLEGGAVGVFAGTLQHSGVVQAHTLAREGGRLVLKAQGEVVLGAGSQVQADGQKQGGAITITSETGAMRLDAGSHVSAQALSNSAPGQAATQGGQVQLSATQGLLALESGSQVNVSAGQGGSVDVVGERILQSGSVQADGSAGAGGVIRLDADSRLIQTQEARLDAHGTTIGGHITVSVDTDPQGSAQLFSSARIDASASSGVGGTVHVTGQNLTFAGARILANGDAGGGTVQLGGGRAGTDVSLANAQNLTATAASSVEASARVDGDGGTVVAWANGTNRFAGVVEARGGAQAGDGGFIEVSGKEQTQFGGVANASAPHGKAGSFLLDPKYILIEASAQETGVSVELLDPNPGTNDYFGQYLDVLNGGATILVRNPADDLGATNAGAIYLFDGVTGALLSHLRGSSANDQIGSAGYTTLSGSVIALRSPNWTNPAGATGVAANAGAITWYDTATGLSGIVSSSNSLVGGFANDAVASNALSSLGSGNYYAYTPQWNAVSGAITFVSATAAKPTGMISPQNSLVGANANDRLGSGGILTSGGGSKIVLLSPHWSSDKGAVTWYDRAGTYGVVDASNSLVGTSNGDLVGSNYAYFGSNQLAVLSPSWNGGAGAITWGNFLTATTGPISGSNSLYGSQSTDGVGSADPVYFGYVGGGYKYYVYTTGFNSDAGAITWIDANAPAMGAVSASNSLVGANPGDEIGSGGIHVTDNQDLVVVSPNATVAGVANAGAVTWASGFGGPSTQGTVDASNSFVGTATNDQVGSGEFVTGTSGSFVFGSPQWGGGRGAATFGNGSQSLVGSADGATTGGNSVYGQTTTSAISSSGVRAANNGHFVVFSAAHGTGALANLGAVTIGDAANGFLDSGVPIVGGVVVSNTNSIVGTQAGDQVGLSPNSYFYDRGGYWLLRTPNLHGIGGAANAGAVTFIAGVPVAGDVNTLTGALTNSIVGATAGDAVGNTITFLNNDNFIVISPSWDAGGGLTDAGAVTFGDQTTGFASSGLITSSNSLVGSQSNDRLGSSGVIKLSDGDHYLIRSPYFALDGGAVTWADGITAITGQIGSESNGNSIYGEPGGEVGSGGIQFLDYYYYYTNSGNFVVISPDSGGMVTPLNSGAVTFGTPGAGFANPGVVSAANSLVGSSANDRVGSGGIQRLYNPIDYSSSSYLIKSPSLGGTGAGALTWASATAPVYGTITSAINGNSIFGTFTEAIGSGGIQILDNYHFVVVSPGATNGSTTDAGAVTFGRYDSGFTAPGEISTANSLMGTNVGDRLGSGGIASLYGSSQTNYLIRSPLYSSGAGAVTWASGVASITGEVGSELNGNSLVGNPGDALGSVSPYFNTGGSYNFVLRAPNAFNTAGAVSFGTQAAGFASPGLITSGNSLVGSANGDVLGSGGVQFLSNDLFAVLSPEWNSAAGAISWGNETTGISGFVDPTTSLMGVAAGDRVGDAAIVSLGSGYYARTAAFNSNAGAITYVDPASPIHGFVDSTNSLLGSTAGDAIGSGGVVLLGNNKAAVFSPLWSHAGATAAGAVTWLDTTAAMAGLTGIVTSANSLVGSTLNDKVGDGGQQGVSGSTLRFVRSGLWDNGAATDAGAMTWFDAYGSLPTGAVSASNSLVGSNANDKVGSSPTITTGDGYFLVRNASWNGNRAAVSWMTAGAPLTGELSASNSLVGANPNDSIGSGGIYANAYYYLANGDYVVSSPSFASSSGAVTIGSATSGITGVVSGANSLVGLGTSFQYVNNRTRLLVKNANATNEGLTNAGRVCLYAGGAGCASFVALGSQLFNNNAGASITLSPNQIMAMLNMGTDVLLQASSDITLGALSDISVNNASGSGGKLTLQAGRSVYLNSSIFTDDGDLDVIANELTSNGVLTAYRDLGSAVIAMADGTQIDAGTGTVRMLLRDGQGRTEAQAQASDIQLRSIAAGTLVARSDTGSVTIGSLGATAPSEIVVLGDASIIAKTSVSLLGGRAGAPALLSARGQITIASPDTAIDPAPVLTLISGGSSARIVNPTRTFRLILSGSQCIGCTVLSDYEIIGGGSNAILESITSALLTLQADFRHFPKPPSPDNDDDIGIDTGETCQ